MVTLMEATEKAGTRQVREKTGAGRNVQEVEVAKHSRAFKSEKRRKEISRLKKQEEKRQRRFSGQAETEKESDAGTETDILDTSGGETVESSPRETPA